MIFNVLFVLAFVWAAIATFILLRNPLPFPDRGHRVFGVSDDKARQAVVNLLKEIGGFGERFTFDSGVMHQTLIGDGYTTIMYLDTEVQKHRNLSGTGLSVPVKNPEISARKAVEYLQRFALE